ncbi:unnamed protein product [Hermetia illucens]|uniref:SOGA coiled-coil domain-containing protein n=1 Tax=Hermetia illucens TaxID=343691 RepID=A0A7R8USU0_HERIL|nr:myosin-11 isoform X3 [Hermetia illucens]CAD7085418.1 unnamed protein product [Hermetia illucens]
MHHMYPLSKGDQLCPLGFHPQVRWPTRCKRCFRDYKEHGGKRGGEDIAASSPSLTDSSMKPPGRSWTSTQNLSSTSADSNGNDIVVNYCVELRKRPSSWTSTPDLEDIDNKDAKSTPADVSVRVQLPARRSHTTAISHNAETEESFTMRRPPLPPTSKESPDDWVILKTDSLAERVRKMNLKKQKSMEREGSREKSVPRKADKEKSPSVESDRERNKAALAAQRKHEDAIKASQDVQFLIKVKENSVPRQDDDLSVTTETTDTTLVDPNDHNLQNEVKMLRQEYELMKARAERAEREKSDILLRRLASIDTGPNRTAASEALKLQQKVNEMKTQLEELRDEKRCLSLKVRELEHDLESRPAKTIEEELRRKLQAAEQLCEELMDENEDIKKELRGMEQEIDEMHDNFREDQVEEFATMCKKFEQTEKNCRVLSFKLKKSERKIEQLEKEKQTLISQNSNDLLNKIQKLEDDLKAANDLARRLQSEADQTKNPNKKKAPTLGVIGKSTSADGKVTRESLTRGGSQEDPAQLLRDLQDSMEREADLKEQLKFAEREAETLRKKASRIEDENESLMMQLKKMATRAKKPPVEHDEGISDEDDPAELRVLLELNEQEATVLRQKVEDLESENNSHKRQIKELQEKLKSNSKNDIGTKRISSLLSKSTNASEQKLKALEDEMSELRRTIAEKERNIEKLTAEISALKSNSSRNLIKANSSEGNDQQLDLKRQMQMVEQEASILRGKISNLEQENEKLTLENKKLQMQYLRKNSSLSLTKNTSNVELSEIKERLSKTEKERDELRSKLEEVNKEASDKLPPRTPKKVTDLTPKATLKKFIDELEDEIKGLRIIVAKSSGENVKKLENEKTVIQKELKDVKDQLNNTSAELKKLKTSKDSATAQAAKLSELELKFKKSDVENSKLSMQIKELEEKIKAKDTLIKQGESVKSSLDGQIKKEKEKYASLEKTLEKEKKEASRWEARVTELDDELSSTRKNFEKMKTSWEKEIQDLKSKMNSKTDAAHTKKLQELRKQLEDTQADLTRESKKYSELNARYETLQEEHVLSKAQLTAEKHNLQSDLGLAKQKLSEVDVYKTEKLNLEKKLKEAQTRISELESKNINSKAKEYEKNMLRSTIAERDREIEKLKKENEMNGDLASQMRKENEELRRKLDDFERVSKAQRSLNDYNSTMEKELKKLQVKLENSELTAKSEVASTRLRYEQQIKNIQSELNSMQRQCERFKKDRDTFKQLLESAQKTIGELKQNSGRVSRASLNSGDEDDKGKILALEQQLGCLEDQLSEARLEASRYKTELVQERSANEIKIAEMTSKLNEYEEDRLLGSGRTKIAGMKTKLELSWQKEREEQQRLLQETATLARDLRQTLFEVERERDKERIESKRKLEHLKRATEEEMEEGRKKISELQCDLLELRDAHAKLRTSNEKLRRERERYEREIARRRMEHDGERKVGVLLQTVDELVKIAPDLQIASKSSTPKVSSQSPAQSLKPELTRRTRSPSPGPNSMQISTVLARLAEASEELRRFQRLCEEEKERDRSRRSGMRRAASTENEPQMITRNSSSGKLSRSSTHNGSLIRKSLSLDHSIQQDQSIWRQDDGSLSSMQSIDSELGGMVRDSSMDSRLSGGSTQSDLPRGPRKKKRGIMGKLRSLTKSSRTGSESSIPGSDSDVSTASADIRGSKKDLKGRLSGMFKRSNSATRSNSSERLINDSEQKPVAVTMLGSNNSTPAQSQPTTPKVVRSATKPPTPTTPVLQRRTK